MARLHNNHLIFSFKTPSVLAPSFSKCIQHLNAKDEHYLKQKGNVTFGLTRRKDSHKHARGESDSCG